MNVSGSIPEDDTLGRHRREVATAAGLLAATTTLFAAFAARGGADGARLLAASALFGMLFLPCAGLAVNRWTDRLRGHLAPAPALRAGLVWIAALLAYLVYAFLAARFDPAPAARAALYGLVPLLLLLRPRRATAPLESPLRLALAIAAFWFPIEFHWVGDLPLPVAAANALDATRLLAFGWALFLFRVVAPVADLGYTFQFTRRDFGLASVALAAFAVVAIPLGLAIGFLHVAPVGFDPLEWIARGLAIGFLVALPEEVLFRGLFQNLLEKRWPGRARKTGSLAVAAVVFGAAHLDNAPAPNLPYAALATLAGLAYGWVWQRTRKVTAAALTHAAVDWVWGLLLGGG